MEISREAQAHRALEILGVERFVRFVRAVRHQSAILRERDMVAVRLISDDIDDGTDVRGLFDSKKDVSEDDGDYGYTLSVREVKPLTFEIDFGCLAGPMAGDGGTWRVIFDEAGEVVEATGETAWIS